MLDLAEANPLSRLGPVGGGGLTRLRGVVGAWCRTEARREAASAATGSSTTATSASDGSNQLNSL